MPGDMIGWRAKTSLSVSPTSPSSLGECGVRGTGFFEGGMWEIARESLKDRLKKGDFVARVGESNCRFERGQECSVNGGVK